MGGLKKSQRIHFEAASMLLRDEDGSGKHVHPSQYTVAGKAGALKEVSSKT